MDKKEQIRQQEERLAELRKMLNDPNADLEAIEKEIDEIIEKRDLLIKELEKEERLAKLNKVLTGGQVIRNFNSSQEHYNEDSAEYRTAFLKTIAKRVDSTGRLSPMFGELTENEKRAFVMTTENTGVVIPTATANKIVDLVKSSNALLADLDINRFLTPYKVPIHKEIVAGDAAETAEDQVPENEKSTWDEVSLVGFDIKKGVELSENVRMQSIAAFEQWLIKHLISRMYNEANAKTYEKIETQLTESNKITTQSGLTDKDLLKALGDVAGGNVRVYANRKTIFNYIATIKDTQGRQIFYDAKENPLEHGVIHGAIVKEDSSLPDDVVFVGAPEYIEANIFEDANIVALPQKGRLTYYDGFMKYDCALLNPKAFLKLTITPAV